MNVVLFKDSREEEGQDDCQIHCFLWHIDLEVTFRESLLFEVTYSALFPAGF